MRLENRTILITSNEPWGDVWYSKHNYANELAKDNDVIFIDPPGRWRPAALAGAAPVLLPVSPRLHVLRYRNVLPALNMALFRLNNRIVSRAIRKLLRSTGRKENLLLAFDPFRLVDPAQLGAERSAFFAVDAHVMTTLGERCIYRNVDKIITISPALNERYLPFGKPMLTLDHAIPADQFGTKPKPTGHAGHGLFVGNLDARLDLPFIRRMAETFPNVPFVFIGPYALHGRPEADLLFRSGTFRNIYHHEPVPFKELGGYIADARFCLAPLNVQDPRNAISHHKIFHYLALGKPVFSPVFSAYLPIAGLLYMNNDADALLAQLAEFLRQGEAPELTAKRISFARTRTYDHNIAAIANFLLAPK